MNITIAICTWNRAALLAQTLAEIHKLQIPSGVEWELLVVNNNCTDETDEVIARHSSSLPLRRLLEPRQGQSHARNCALQNAASEWLIFTDDDVLVSPSWLVSYCSAVAECGDSVAFLGGEIVPWFPTPPDEDLVAGIPTVGQGFCGLQLPQELLIDGSQLLPLGANFAVRRSLVGAQQFDGNLGLVGTRRVVGEETAFLRDLIERGFSGRWVPNACVAHYVDPQRLSLRYLRNHFFGIGQTDVRLNGIPSGRRLLGIPACVVRGIIGAGLRMLWNRAINRRKEFYHNFARFYRNYGVLREIAVYHLTRRRLYYQ